jgi:hypothetical protein
MNDSAARGEVSRRQFVGTGLAAAGGLMAGGSAFAQNGRVSEPEWFNRPMRWAQLTLVENDPGLYDPAFWLDYFRRTHSDAACLSAGGYIAYYPTKIPLHYRSQWMKDTDPFGELVEGCRKMDMVVVARTDSHAVHNDAYEAHPEWIAVDAEGNKRRHWAAPERWVTCALGPYNFEFMTEVHKEIMSEYMVDGIFINRWAGSGMCYCQHCQKNFREAHGMDLPRTRDPQDPARRNYILWSQQRLLDLWQLWDREMRVFNPNSRCIPNTGGGALSGLDMKRVGELADTLMSDRQARRGLALPWANAKNAKEYRAAMGAKPVVGIFSIGLEEPYRWKDSVQTAPEIHIWVAEGTAHGMRPWFTKFGGVIHDDRWLKPVEDIYKWHKAAERYLRNEESLARVALVYSQQSAWFYGGEQARAKLEDHTLGMYQALVESRIPFEMAHDQLLEPERISRFKTLILPNIAALSDRQCDQIREYVRRGGSIVATYETSLYDEWGKPRSNFGLADLFGVAFTGQREDRMQNSYLRLDHQQGGVRHPILRGLEDAPRIVNSVRRLDVRETAQFPRRPVTLIPSYPDLPMEEVYPRQLKTDILQVCLREIGPSRVVYFPGDMDRTFWEVLAEDHGKLLRNVVEWATNEERPATVTGPGLLDIAVWQQKESMTVHLVNLSNPMTMKGPYREVIPLAGQEATVRLPVGKKARKVHLLVSGQTPKITQRDGAIRLALPPIGVHEVIAIDL